MVIMFSYSMKGKTKHFFILLFCSFINGNGNFFGWYPNIGIWPGILPSLENLPNIGLLYKVDRRTGNQYKKIYIIM